MSSYEWLFKVQEERTETGTHVLVVIGRLENRTTHAISWPVLNRNGGVVHNNRSATEHSTLLGAVEENKSSKPLRVPTKTHLEISYLLRRHSRYADMLANSAPPAARVKSQNSLVSVHFENVFVNELF
jgi:hypothetical protein